MGPEECFTEDELAQQTVNIVRMRALPSLVESESDEMITYISDVSFFKYILPHQTQSTNMFYKKSEITLEDFNFDIFNSEEATLDLFENNYNSENIQQWPSDLPVAEREYLAIFIRNDDGSNLYKREEDNMMAYFGDLGGLLDIVLVLGSLFCSSFVGKLLDGALIG